MTNFTKGHFETVAAVLRDERAAAERDFMAFRTDEPMHLLIDRVARAFANEFEMHNPRFNRDKFLTAAGCEIGAR